MITSDMPANREMHEMQRRGVYFIFGDLRGAEHSLHINNEVQGGRGNFTTYPVRATDHVTIEIRKSPHAHQLVFITQNRHDNLVLRRKDAHEMDRLQFVAPNPDIDLGSQPTGLGVPFFPGITLMLEINDEHYCIIPAYNQALVFITQGGNDRLHIADNIDTPIIVNTGEGDDSIISAASIASFYTGAGNDTVIVHGGSNYIDTGEGDDDVTASKEARITVYAGPGDDDVMGGGFSFIDGGQGNDDITGGPGHNILSGGPGSDHIKAGPSSNVIFTGQGTRDLVTALKPHDITYHTTHSTLAINCPTTAEAFASMPNGQPTSRSTLIEPKDISESGITVKGSVSFIERIHDDLRLLLNSPTGQKLLTVLHQAALKSGTPITINELTLSKQNNFVASDAPSPNAYLVNGQRASGSYGGNIWINTSNSLPDLPDQPGIIILFHELCHAYNYVTGSVVPGGIQDPQDGSLTARQERQAIGLPASEYRFDFDDDPSTPPTDTNPEAFTENGLRKELGLPLRERYDN